MSKTTTSGKKSSSPKADALKALAKAPEGQKKLLTALCNKIDDADIALIDTELLVKMVECHWALSKKHVKNKSVFSVYTLPATSTARSKTIIDIVSDDAAFLVDSSVAEVNRHNLLIHLLVHPILYVKYDSSGALKDITDQRSETMQRQSHIHIQIEDTLSDELLAKLKEGLTRALADVFIANKHWKEMLNKLHAAREELAGAITKYPKKEVKEYCEFLDYLHNNNFTMLGYREYEFSQKDGELKSKIVKGTGLGLLADDVSPAYISETEEGLPRNLQQLRKDLPPVSISKTNRLSTVHRRVPMDAIAIKTYNKNGEVKGEKLFIGLFTSVTYSRSVSDVPFLREKVEQVVEKSGFIQGSHNRKAMRHILEKYPRDELFQMDNEELYKTVLDILRLQERQRIALFMRLDPFKRYVSCLVYIPKDRFGTKLRKRMAKILEEELNGTLTNFYSSMDDSVFARVMFIVNVNQANPPKYNAAKIEERLQDVGKTWPDLLSGALVSAYSEDKKIHALTLRYSDAFPLSYTSNYDAKQGVFDIEKIEVAYATNQLVVDLYRPKDVTSNQLRLKAYNIGQPLTLSDVLPLLEDMGLRAIAELPFEVKPAGEAQSLWIHDFLLETPGANEINVEDMKQIFETAFIRIWYNKSESDSLNRLVLSAKANWHEITILRAYVRYLRQINFPFSRPYIERALTEHPKISRMVIDLFKALHNPANGSNSSKMAADCAVAIDKALEKVDSLDQDRTLRVLTALVEATMRTNYFQREKDGSAKPYLSLKLNSKAVPDLPEPRPFMEIFVYSPRVEAIHLRGDKIARGGLRWSDRHEDFRTEVLGLMKAQQVKNAVIVPMGAKGGFVVKTIIKDRKEYLAEGIECYKIFIRGLLDITDNRKGKKIIPPKDVVRRDEDDPYLVVAADKGTATFSDIANSISLEYGFWMGDAFASGGSAGYDHKKMGITAKGAWESVKLHFRQLNHNTQTQGFSVIGVGDMGGDVFGNGMLLSEQIHLFGAFNHIHIFCDPNPDAAKSFKERQRLFDGVMGWDQYDPKILSKGGRVFNRSEKVLLLTPEIQQRFDIHKEKVSPIELMRAILKAQADLLWVGGIGTYVKSTKESHLDASDKANDAIRINANELRVKVIGEGANMALTQLSRIEFAEKGGKVNTDFLDNSAGVNSSDVEVNIKILMADVMSSAAHNMDIKARNKLLEKMTAEVSAHVLRNNYQQAQAISLAELQARETLQIQEEFIEDLEREVGLDRNIEKLPDAAAIAARLRAGKGMTRPELCILLSYSKIRFTQDLLDSDIPDNALMNDWLMDYFPTPLQKNYKTEIQRHLLNRNLIATMMANSLVNRMGPTFVKSRMRKTGASAAEVAKAYLVVRDAFGLRALWDEIEALDNKVPAEVQLKAMREIAHLAEYAITWFLTRLGRGLDLVKDAADFRQGIETLRNTIGTIQLEDLQQSITQRAQVWQRDGLPQELAQTIALMPVLTSACDIIRISLQSKSDITLTARTYFEIGGKFHLDWLRQQARFMTSEDHWHAEAVGGMMDQLYSAQAGLTVHILKEFGGKKAASRSAVEKWLMDHSTQVEQLDPLFAELRRAGTVDLAMLVIAVQRLQNLYGG